VKDEGVVFYLQIKAVKKMEYFNLTQTSISIEVIKNLLKSKYLESLIEICIRDCSNIKVYDYHYLMKE
jgi:hypothetical protein